MNEKLQTGDYCEVTREQAIELLTIEGYEHPDHYAGGWHDSGNLKYARYEGEIASNNGEILLAGMVHWDFQNKFTFEDFKQRLINTVKK